MLALADGGPATHDEPVRQDGHGRKWSEHRVSDSDHPRDDERTLEQTGCPREQGQAQGGPDHTREHDGPCGPAVDGAAEERTDPRADEEQDRDPRVGLGARGPELRFDRFDEEAVAADRATDRHRLGDEGAAHHSPPVEARCRGRSAAPGGLRGVALRSHRRSFSESRDRVQTLIRIRRFGSRRQECECRYSRSRCAATSTRECEEAEWAEFSTPHIMAIARSRGRRIPRRGNREPSSTTDEARRSRREIPYALDSPHRVSCFSIRCGRSSAATSSRSEKDLVPSAIANFFCSEMSALGRPLA